MVISRDTGWTGRTEARHKRCALSRQQARPIVLLAAIAAIFACSLLVGRTPAGAVVIASVPAMAVYLLLRKPAKRRWRPYAVYALLLAALLTGYMLVLERVSPNTRVRWSDLWQVMYFVAALHVVLWTIDHAVHAALRMAIGANPGAWLRRGALAARLAGLIVVACPLTASALTTHWIKFDEPADPRQLGMSCADVGFYTADDVNIRAWYLPTDERFSDSAVVLVPGRGMTRSYCLPHARMLCRNGFNVLLIDPRGQGQSQGHTVAFGRAQARDVTGAVDYLRMAHPRGSVHVFAMGLSQGACAALTAARDDLRIEAVIAESPAIGARAELERTAWCIPRPVKNLFVDATLAIGSASLGDELDEPAPAAISGCRPLLVIQGTDDDPEAVRQAERLQAASCPSMLWRVGGAGAAQAYLYAQADYERIVVRTLRSVQTGMEAFGWLKAKG